MSTYDSGTLEERNITVQQILRAYRIKRALEEYEKFLEAKAYEFAWKTTPTRKISCRRDEWPSGVPLRP
jgi:hypothetical protein